MVKKIIIILLKRPSTEGRFLNVPKSLFIKSNLQYLHFLQRDTGIDSSYLFKVVQNTSSYRS